METKYDNSPKIKYFTYETPEDETPHTPTKQELEQLREDLKEYKQELGSLLDTKV